MKREQTITTDTGKYGNIVKYKIFFFKKYLKATKTFNSNPKSINRFIEMSIEAIRVFYWQRYAVWKRKEPQLQAKTQIHEVLREGSAVVKTIRYSRRLLKKFILGIFSKPTGTLIKMISWKGKK